MESGDNGSKASKVAQASLLYQLLIGFVVSEECTNHFSNFKQHLSRNLCLKKSKAGLDDPYIYILGESKKCLSLIERKLKITSLTFKILTFLNQDFLT